MTDSTRERHFQNAILQHLTQNGWQQGDNSGYDKARALYPEDLVRFLQTAWPTEWEKFTHLHGEKSQTALLDLVTQRLTGKPKSQTAGELRKYGVLGALREPLRTRNITLKCMQAKPESIHNQSLNHAYKSNIFRVVEELNYSEEGKGRIDLVLFLNGLPIATLELKSEYKQSIDDAINQYKYDRNPRKNGQKEPLLTFKEGALVHFAVSQFDVYMTTKLEGDETFFLPFNRGTKEGGAGNELPANPQPGEYATQYLWQEVLSPGNLLDILEHFIHLEVKPKTDARGRKTLEERLIFPRYHQWDVVRKLVAEARAEALGQRYLIQHSAGSGKSNSIAWTAHQLSKLQKSDGSAIFDSVIVVTDRRVLDQQLQATISQFQRVDGVVEAIREGGSSKSEQLSRALIEKRPIIIVTIQSFPFVLQHLEENVALKANRYAIIADEAHSSQTGSTAGKLKQTLSLDGEVRTGEDALNAITEKRRHNPNLNYYAFTATPKAKTLELFGTLPDPSRPIGPDNLPKPFHLYTMRQAIEEGFIIDVLKNYTNYEIAFQLAKKLEERADVVDRREGSRKAMQWVRLHGYNIGQKVKVIVEHFRNNVKHLLGGHAKAMIVTSSRKEVVLYKRAIDDYIRHHQYTDIDTLAAFSGEVLFTEDDPHAEALIGTSFTEHNINPDLRGREIPEALDSEDYQLLLVANKFQTGFDQPKLCAMYVDKKLGGVECVQTLSRLNRTYPGKSAETVYILDFINTPEEIQKAFLPYYKSTDLAEASDPDLVFELFDKLCAADLFTWHEVERFVEVYLDSNERDVSSFVKPARDRWSKRYRAAFQELERRKKLLERTKGSQDPILIANAEDEVTAAEEELEALILFKKDLGSYTRFYSFISQLVEFESPDLERLNIFARYLMPLLKETPVEPEYIDLSNLEMTHYRITPVRQGKIELDNEESEGVEGSTAIGSGRIRKPEEVLLDEIIESLNALFRGSGLESDKEELRHWFQLLQHKTSADEEILQQILNNPEDQVMYGEFPNAVNRFVEEIHGNDLRRTMIYRNSPKLQQEVPRLLLEAIKREQAPISNI